MTPITHFTVRHNPTGKEWAEPFTAGEWPDSNGPFPSHGLSLEQALGRVGCWNRAQSNYQREFSYRVSRD